LSDIFYKHKENKQFEEKLKQNTKNNLKITEEKTFFKKINRITTVNIIIYLFNKK
jgi:adenylyl- and sulfurtransferase ThiI